MISPINHAAGVWPVVLTPFRPDGKIDFPAYRKLLEYYIAEAAAFRSSPADISAIPRRKSSSLSSTWPRSAWMPW